MTVSTSVRWPAAATPRVPLRAAIARMIFEHAVQPVPVRVTYPDGRVLGGGSETSPEFELVRPAAFFARLGRDAKVGFGPPCRSFAMGPFVGSPVCLGLVLRFEAAIARQLEVWQRFCKVSQKQLLNWANKRGGAPQ